MKTRLLPWQHFAVHVSEGPAIKTVTHWVPIIEHWPWWIYSIKPEGSNWAYHLEEDYRTSEWWVWPLLCWKWVTWPSFSGIHRHFIEEQNFWNSTYTKMDMTSLNNASHFVAFLKYAKCKWTHVWNRNRLTDIENRLVVARGEGGMNWDLGISRCKLQYTEWINNKVLRDSTGNYIQYPGINHNEKNMQKCVCVYKWITLLYSRNLHNIVNQLYCNKISEENECAKVCSWLDVEKVGWESSAAKVSFDDLFPGPHEGLHFASLLLLMSFTTFETVKA